MNTFEYNEFSDIQTGIQPFTYYLSTLTFSKYYLQICSQELQKQDQKARTMPRK